MPVRSFVARLDPRRAPAVVLLLAPPVLLVLIVGLTPEPTRLILAGDLSLYHRWGLQLLGGSIPYLDFNVEYPPLALVPMTLPLLAPPHGGIDDVGYIWRFTLAQGALATAVGWLLFEATGRSRSTLVLWAVLVGLAWASVALRYDLWPVLCVLVAVVVVERNPGAAGVALGLGTMLKLYPLALLPVLGAYALARRDRAGFVRLLVGCTSVVVLVMGAAWVLAGPASLQWLLYQQERGLQIESLGAGLLLGLHVLAGQPLDVANAFGSVQVRAPGSDLLVAASPIELAVLLGVVTAVAALRFRRDYARLGRVPSSSLYLASAAAIAVLLVGSKVLSVQYVIWLLPFVIFLPHRMGWLLIAITALSTAIYTTDYSALGRLETPMIAALLVRNALVLVFAAWLVVQLGARARTRPPEPIQGVGGSTGKIGPLTAPLPPEAPVPAD
ncbi:MAG TPA: glycosyltransferase 87 family protein [Propionibacteriaceae bacterium]